MSLAVEYTLRRETAPDGTETVTETVRVTYSQDWKAYNAAKNGEKDRFAALLADLCGGNPQPEQAMGRPRLPLRDMVFASVYKVYCGFSSRRFACDLKEAHAGGLISKAPHFNSVSNHLSDPALTGILKELVTISSLPLKAIETDFAVDSSGFSTSTYGRWFDRKYGVEKDRRDWFKAHLIVGVVLHQNSVLRGNFGSTGRCTKKAVCTKSRELALKRGSSESGEKAFCT